MKEPKVSPPRLFLRFFRWYCHPKMHAYIEGDLMEVYYRRLSHSGKMKADLGFIVDVLLLFRPGIIKPTEGTRNLNNYGMLKSYFKIGWRNLLKNKSYSAINILGLAIGLAACLLITLYVRYELSFDRFHEKADRIYRVNMELKFGENHMDMALTNALFGETAKADFPQIEQVTRLRWYGSFLVKKGDAAVREGNVAWADSTLFDVFTLPMIHGDPRTALREPNSIVITEALAKKYFDKTDVVGMTLTLDNASVRKITGVIKVPPENSHFKFYCFIPLVEDKSAIEETWAGSQNWSTYLLLKPGAEPADLVHGLNKMVDKHLGPELQAVINITLDQFKSQGGYFKVSLTKLTDIHLTSNRIGELYGNGNIQYVYIFSAIAIFILLIACVNFMNLATARAANRAREVGIRKVMGSFKSGLIQQFLTESFITCILSAVLAIIFTIACLPYFNDLTGKAIDSSMLYSPVMIMGILTMVVAVGLLAGSYPAFYLSAFKPAEVLKGSKNGGGRKSIFRNALVVFQFTASVILIAGTIIIYQQMKFIRTKDVGYSRDHILLITNTVELGKRADVLRTSILELPEVEKAAASGFLPVNYYRSNDSFFQSPTLATQDAISMQDWIIDENYIPTMEMQLVEGRNFSKDLAADTAGIILNESAARFLGSKNLLDKRLYRLIDITGKSVAEYHVIGIVKDFNYSTLREYVKPLAFIYGADKGSLNLRINTADIPSLLVAIEKKWKAIVPELPFEYSFMDEDFNNLYTGEKQIGKLLTIFASLSIFISCLGLFGLATFMADQRTKEIGIRKVLGASVSGIATLLSRDFLKLVLIAIAIASPAAYFFMDQWLQGFAYRIDAQWWVFGIAGILAILIALITVSFQAVKSAMMNPVKSLRSE